MAANILSPAAYLFYLISISYYLEALMVSSLELTLFNYFLSETLDYVRDEI